MTQATANTSPTKAVVSFNSKGTNYITVNAKSEDIDGDKLTYTLYYGTSSSSLTATTLLSNQTQNVQVSLTTPTNLSQYTYYYWRVDVSDGKATTQGDVQTRVRTYCPGTGRYCNGPFVEHNAADCPSSSCVDGQMVSPCTGTAGIYNHALYVPGSYCPSCGGSGVPFIALCSSSQAHQLWPMSGSYYYDCTGCGGYWTDAGRKCSTA